MEKTVITSLQNDKIKHIVLLQQKSSERKRTGLFVVEGQRELMHCMDAGYEVESIFWCKSLAPDFRPQINTDYLFNEIKSEISISQLYRRRHSYSSSKKSDS